MRAGILGFVLAASTVAYAASPARADVLNAEEAKSFVAGKTFSFNCFEGTRGAGRILHDGSVAGSIQLSGSGPTRFVQLPPNTLRIKGNAVCASLRGMFFEPCFNVVKTDAQSFRGSLSGMGFAYCEFTRRDNGRVRMARSVNRPQSIMPPASSAKAGGTAPAETRRADARAARARSAESRPEAKSEAKPEAVALELRSSQD